MFKSLWYKVCSSKLAGKAQAIWYILRGKGVVYRVKFKGGFSCIDPDGTLILENHFVDITPASEQELVFAQEVWNTLCQAGLPKLSGQ